MADSKKKNTNKTVAADEKKKKKSVGAESVDNAAASVPAGSGEATGVTAGGESDAAYSAIVKGDGADVIAGSFNESIAEPDADGKVKEEIKENDETKANDECRVNDEGLDVKDECRVSDEGLSDGEETEATGASEKEQSKLMKAVGAVGAFFAKIGKTVWRWLKRTVLGASKELTKEQQLEVEKIESPTKQVVKNFFRKPIAVISLVILVGMFLFVFIGSAALPLDLSYNEQLQQNLAPGYTSLSVPKKLKNNVKSISSYSNFSVGLDNNGNVYTWGNTKIANSSSKADLSKLPDDIKGGGVAFVAAGRDHAIAITTDGKVVGWGEHDCAQYGNDHKLTNSMVVLMPSQLMNGTIDASRVKQLVCGYQVSAIVMDDGLCYAWGNRGAGATNLEGLANMENVEKVAFLGSAAMALLKDGTVWLGQSAGAFETIEIDGAFVNLFDDYLAGRKVVDIAATSGSIALLTEDGELITSGNLDSSVLRPTLDGDEEVVQIEGGAKHYTALTNKGRLFSFGSNALGQCKTPKGTFAQDVTVYACAFQNYIVNSNGKLIEKWGLKGYLFGTDNLGRDVFARIVNGGRMTMTIGAVAVIISTVIAVIIGCLSGYFGGKVDMILMRVTEVFGAIPFLPFALILSAVLAGTAVTETTRIFIIMVILGVLSWTGLAHMIRGQVLAEREKEFVTAARAMGVKSWKIAFKHILPNIISIILVSVTLDFAGCMLTEASLSYLGFGVKLPKPTWGNMLNGANNSVVIANYWWQWLFPSLFLLVTTIAINLIGDALRDVMDPKSSAER